MEAFSNAISEGFSGKDFNSADIMDMKEMPKMTKKSKDPNAPKKALGAWIFFTNETRPKLKKKNSDKSMTELTTMMSHLWQECSEKDKVPYQKMAEEDKVRYKEEKDKYQSQNNSQSDSGSGSDSDKEETKVKKVKKVKDPNAPKRNLNIYMHFCKDIRSKNPDVKHTAAALKTMWADIEDKEPYQKMADEDKARYLKEKKEYEESL